jgi:cold shock CspA family protein
VEVAEAEAEYLAEGEEVEADVEEDERGTGRIRRSTAKKYKGETVSIQKQ